jgi:heme exporter protein A
LPPDDAAFVGQDLACRRGGRLIFAELSFALAPGEALLLRGPNGSGKSSLLRLLAGLARPAGGSIRWHKSDIADDRPAHRARTHLLGQADALKPVLSIAENLHAVSGLLGGNVPVDEALAEFDLRSLAATPARFLSTGQRRRAALARLIAVPRPLWLLDEPGVGLDRSGRAALEAAIARHLAAGGTCIAASHGDVTLADPLVLDFSR